MLHLELDWQYTKDFKLLVSILFLIAPPCDRQGYNIKATKMTIYYFVDIISSAFIDIIRIRNWYSAKVLANQITFKPSFDWIL
jgi:hypothetical protein